MKEEAGYKDCGSYGQTKLPLIPAPSPPSCATSQQVAWLICDPVAQTVGLWQQHFEREYHTGQLGFNSTPHLLVTHFGVSHLAYLNSSTNI